MSASLVRKSLQLVENQSKDSKCKHSNQRSLNLTKTIYKKGKKEKIKLLQTQKKLTVEDLKKQLRDRQNKLEENVDKLKRLHASVQLDKETANLILERAIQKRPVSIKQKRKTKAEKSIFTEEDFKDIEEEYFKE